MPTRNMALEAHGLRLGYGTETVITDADLEIPEGSFTALIGPNASGKSTLLRGLSRLLRPSAGTVLLRGSPIARLSNKEAARIVGLLPQSSLAPEGITARSLVERGRFPHHGLLPRWTDTDEQAVIEAMTRARVSDLSDRIMDELSGGQRQRVWVAMLLAQETPIMLLDEPTTFLDIAHQYELMELFRDFHEQGKTIISVLHDLNQAARYASHLVVMTDGRIIATGPPATVITADLIEQVFGLRALVVPDPVTGTPNVVPLDPRSTRIRVPSTPTENTTEKESPDGP